jgi:hypothetical protein
MSKETLDKAAFQRDILLHKLRAISAMAFFPASLVHA